MRQIHQTTLIGSLVVMLVACGSDNPSDPGVSATSHDGSSSSLCACSDAQSSSDGISTGGESSGSVSSGNVSSDCDQCQSSSVGGTSVFTPSSSAGGASIITPSSSVGGTSVIAPSSSTGSISEVTPSSSSSTGGTSVVNPSSSSSLQPVSSSSLSWPPFAGNKSYGEYVDSRDGNKVYKTLLINGRTVMAQNLDYGVRVNGVGASDNQSNNGQIEKYCYDDDPAMCEKYGALYQWAEAMALPSSCNTTTCENQINTPFHQGICPSGWHIMTTADWGQMILGSLQGGKILKATVGWGAGFGDNSTGFTALPGGQRPAAGKYEEEGSGAYFYKVDEGNSNKQAAYTIQLDNIINGYYNTALLKFAGASIRCMQDF